MTRFGDLTICVKAFRRPAALDRLYASLIDAGCQDVPVLVHDDGGEPARVPDALNVRLLSTPFNVGLSAGRNRLVEAADTSMIALLDDDFVVDGRSLSILAEVVAAGRCELAAGAIRTPTGYWQSGWLYLRRDGSVAKTHRCYDEAVLAAGGERITLQFVHQANNFFVADRAFVRSLGWDERLLVKEHNDFFLRAARCGRIAYVPETEVLHIREEPEGYAAFRYGITEAEKAHLMEKWGFVGVRKEDDWFDYRPLAPVLAHTEVPVDQRISSLPYLRLSPR